MLDQRLDLDFRLAACFVQSFDKFDNLLEDSQVFRRIYDLF